MPSYLHDAKIDNETIAKKLFYHCSFKNEKNQLVENKLITLLKKSLLPSGSLSVCHVKKE